jgi:hypothetical protein
MIEKESELQKISEDQLRFYEERITDLQEQLRQSKDVSAKDQSEAAVCQCCDRTDVTMDQLVKIDSGQMLCQDCINELKAAG